MTTQISTTNYLHSIDEALTVCAAANSEWQSFDNQLAAAVAWSLANRFQYFWSELQLVDHPKNPRRARSEDDISPRLAVKVFEVILGKLEQYTSRLYGEALNNPVDAIAEEAEAQFDILEDVRQRLGAVAYQAKIDAETSRFEPASQAA